MALLDGILQGLLELSEGVNDLLHQSLPSWSKLDSVADETTLLAVDGSVATAVRVDGMQQLPGDAEFGHALEVIGRAFAARLGIKEQAHTVQVVFHYDPNAIGQWLNGYFAPSIATMTSHGIGVQEIVDDWKAEIGKYLATEQVWFILWTHPDRLTRTSKKTAMAEQRKRAAAAPSGRQGQSPAGAMNELLNAHKGFVSGILDAFASSGVEAQIAEAEPFLHALRSMVVPGRTGARWRPKLVDGKPSGRTSGENLTPKLPDRQMVPRMRDPCESVYDYSAIMQPNLRMQIFPSEGEVLGRSVLRVADTLHLPLVMHMQPEDPRPFITLFRAMLRRNAPWRVSFTIRPDGVGAFGSKGLIATTLKFGGSTNRRIARAVNELKAYQESGGHVLRLQTVFDTWVRIGADGVDAALAKLQTQAAEMVGSIQGWGTADVSEIWGAPETGFVASLPAAASGSPAPLAAAPLPDILRMLPLTRPSVPWVTGSVLFRSPDGKPMPYALGSNEQAAWVEIGVGQQGAGKSVMINTINWGFLLQPGLEAVPYLSVIDFGASSAGLIRTIQDLAPAELRPFFLYQRLKMVREHGINPFDTGLGCDKPLPRHRSSLTNLLALIATPDDSDAPAEGAMGLSAALTDAAYDTFGEKRKPKSYTAGLCPEVDEAITRFSIVIDRHTSWWEIEHALFDRGEVRLATLAHRYAMPVLADLVALANDPNITSLYRDSRVGGETLTGFFIRRAMEAQAAYPLLAGPTQLDLGVARVVSLDLDEVAPKGSRAADRQSSVMFMLARHVLMGRFFANEDDLPYIPERYRDYHYKHIQGMRQLPKRWVVDEAHRMVRAEASAAQIISDLETATRESRKLNLSIGLYSQSIMDMPEIIIGLCTSAFLMNAGSEKEIKRVCEIWALTAPVQDALRNIRPPDRRGANFLGLFRTKGGFVQQVLTNTVGPMLIVAFESRAEDRVVRDRLYKLIGVLPTLRVIAKSYPRGIKPEVDRRKMLLEDRGLSVNQGEADIVGDIVGELAKAAASLGADQTDSFAG